MRKIKYRLWCKEAEEMREIVKIGLENNKVCWISCVDHDHDFEYFPEDDDFVLMQYTGLKDKNGREIYEGDILRYPFSNYGVDGIAYLEVVYKEEEACFIGRYPSEVGDYEMLNDQDFEVIGNIYENPELLGDLNER